MQAEDNLKLKQKRSFFDANPTTKEFLDIVDFCVALQSGWDYIPELSDGDGYCIQLTENDLMRVCRLIRGCRLGEAAPNVLKESVGPLRKEKDQSALLTPEIEEYFNEFLSVNKECEKDGRFGPFIDAFLLDEPLREMFGGENPFEHISQVLRTYFTLEKPKNFVSAPPVYWERLAGFLDACDAEVEHRIDRNLLVATIKNVLSSNTDNYDAYIMFPFANEEVANTFLATIDILGDDEHFEIIRRLVLLFDIGKPGYSLVKKPTMRSRDGLRQRLSSLFVGCLNYREFDVDKYFGVAATSFWDATSQAVDEQKSLNKTIDIRSFLFLMRRGFEENDDDRQFYDSLSEPLADLITALSDDWPSDVEDLYGFYEMLYEFGLSLDSESSLDTGWCPVALVSALLGQRVSGAGLEEEDSDNRVAYGMHYSRLLRRDGWHRASRDFVGFLLILHALFRDEISVRSRRTLSASIFEDPELTRNRVVRKALEGISAWGSNSPSGLWARQFVTPSDTGAQLSLVRNRDVVSSRQSLEHELQGDIGGEDLWRRLLPHTREKLLDAESLWSDNVKYLGKDMDWASVTGAYFLPFEYELCNRFSFLREKEEIRQACIQRNVKFGDHKLTAGPVIFALKKLGQLPKCVSEAVAQRGINIEQLPKVMNQFDKALHLRNQAFHASHINEKKLIDMRLELFKSGLLHRLASCFPVANDA